MNGTHTTDGLDVLAIGAHPDDVELFCGGTLARLSAAGRKVGLAHLTRGECGTRGDAATRGNELANAAGILGAAEVRTLDLGDGRLADGPEQRLQVVEILRELKPRVVIAHDADERHPDHGAAHELVKSACFLANVGGYKARGERHKVESLVFFHGHERRNPRGADWIVDVSDSYTQKLKALKAYGTQFNASSGDDSPPTYISSPEFWARIEVMARHWGAMIGAEFGEAFSFQSPPHINHPFVRLFTAA